YSDEQIENSKLNRNKKIDNYPISDNRLYRDVKWLRVISRHEIDPSLLYTLRMHQALIKIEEKTKHIDKLISPIHIKGSNIVVSTQVLKKEGINSDEWEELYSAFNKLKFPYQKPEI